MPGLLIALPFASHPGKATQARDGSVLGVFTPSRWSESIATSRGAYCESRQSPARLARLAAHVEAWIVEAGSLNVYSLPNQLHFGQSALGKIIRSDCLPFEFMTRVWLRINHGSLIDEMNPFLFFCRKQIMRVEHNCRHNLLEQLFLVF